MATSKIQVTEGSGKNIASHSFSEDAVTKDVQRVNINNSAGTELGTSSNPVIIEARGVAADGAAVSGNPVLIAGQDGTNVQSIKTDSSGELQVDVLTMPTVTVTGTITASNAAGDVAHDAVDSGNPVKTGGQARITNPVAVGDADRVNATFDDLGRQVVVLSQVRDLTIHSTTTISASVAETTILSAGAAGVFHDIVSIWVANTSATAVRVDFRDATAGTIRFSMFIPASDMRGFIPPVPVVQASAANNWTAQSSASVTDLRIFIQAAKNV